MKRLINLMLIGIILGSTLSGCIIAPIGRGHYYYHDYYYYGR